MTSVVIVLIGLWVVEALALGFTMRMRGFDGYSWTILAAVFGPLALAVAISFLIRPPATAPRMLRIGTAGSGHRHALVGVDGSPEAEAALDRVVALFAGDLGRLVVARVIPLDASTSTATAAEAKLADLVKRHPDLTPALVVLRGEPAQALRDYAEENHFDVIAVGSRGAGFTTALLGSVASELAAASQVPVLVVDTAAARAAAG